MTYASRLLPRCLLALALPAATLAIGGCTVMVQYNSGRTLQEARDAAAVESGMALCDALETPNIGFEEPVIPPEMIYNSYPSVQGWRSPRGEVLVGRGNLNLEQLPDSAAYGDQHGILKPRRSGEGELQANSTLEYTLTLEPGQRYALVLSTMSPTVGNTVELSLEGTDVSTQRFSAQTAWRQRTVPFTATSATVTLRIVSGQRSDVGTVGLTRGELDILVDVAGVFALCSPDAAGATPTTATP